MLLSARILEDVASVNSFEYAAQANWTEGDSLTLYIQLIDASLNTSRQGFEPVGRRYMPPAGSTLVVKLENIDDSKVVTRNAVQPFPEDASIWAIPILPTDKVRGAPQMRLILTEPGPKVTTGIVKNAIKVASAKNVI